MRRLLAKKAIVADVMLICAGAIVAVFLSATMVSAAAAYLG